MVAVTVAPALVVVFVMEAVDVQRSHCPKGNVLSRLSISYELADASQKLSP